MLEILKFVFSDFWIWLGTFLLIGAISSIRVFSTKHYHSKEDK